MDWAGWYTIAIVLVGVGIMAFDIMGPDFAMMGILLFLLIPGDKVVSLDDGISGFSNSGLLTVGILFVMAAGISETGGLDYVFTQILGRPATTRGALVRLMVPICFISAFLNNTPVVAIMIPILLSWSQKAGLAPGHIFIPLSYASILGGTVTLIGTSTNLVVAGKQAERFPNMKAIGIFDLTPYGLPVMLLGMIYIMLFAPKLLPGKNKKRTSAIDEEPALEDAFLVGLLVQPASPAVGCTLQEAGMRGLPGLYLTSVKRGGSIIHAVGPDFIVATGDVLFFAGELSQVRAIAQDFNLRIVADAFEEDLPALMGSPRGRAGAGGQVDGVSAAPSPLPACLERFSPSSHRNGGNSTSTSDSDAALLYHGMARSSLSGSNLQRPSLNLLRRQSVLPSLRLFRATVKEGAPDLLNVTVRNAHFRSRFDAAIVSIRRAGESLQGKFGDVTLQAGDELLFDAGGAFDEHSSEVVANLDKVQEDGGQQEREFMFAFSVDPRKPILRNTSTADLATSSHGTGIVSPPNGAGGSSAGANNIGGSMLGALRGGNIAGKTIESAGLRGLSDAFLVAIERNGRTMHAVPPSEVLQAHDVLWFAGSADGVISLRKIPGLSATDDQSKKLTTSILDRRLVQVVLARGSTLLGKTVRETRFRTRFDAAIIALHRAGQRQRTRIGDIQLAAGDVLLLDTGAHFMQHHRKDRNFALVAEVSNSQPPRFDRVIIAVVCAVVAIALAIANVLDLFIGALAASGIMLLTGCLSGEAARRSVKWDVLVTIAAAFGISNAMENTGAAKAIADLLVGAGKGLGGGAAIQIAVYIATVLLSNIVANNAAAALMYPIAISVAIREGLREDLMAYLLMLAASASFAVPFGYQTNLMVYGAGGYRFKDFVKFGGPMQIWQGVASVGVILLADYWPAVWAGTFAVAVLVLGGPFFWDCWRRRKAKRAGKYKVTRENMSPPASEPHALPSHPSTRLTINTGRQPVEV